MPWRVASTAVSTLSLVVSLGTLAYVALDAHRRGWTLVAGESGLGPRQESMAPERTRVQFPIQTVEDSRFRNHMVSLTHNWSWDVDHGWHRPMPQEPSVALTLESYFRGLAELNLDIGAPGPDAPWRGGRAMGFAARHDGTYTTLSIGGEMFNPAGAGVKLTAGTTSSPAVLITSGAQAAQPAVELRREDDSASLVMFPDGRVEWRDRAGRMTASIVADDSAHGMAGRTTTSTLRIGSDGTVLTGFYVREVELTPPVMAPRAVAEHLVPLTGVTPVDLAFVNGPGQPASVVLTGVRAVSSGAVVITFANLGDTAVAPAAGRYVIVSFAVDAAGRADDNQVEHRPNAP